LAPPRSVACVSVACVSVARVSMGCMEPLASLGDPMGVDVPEFAAVLSQPPAGPGPRGDVPAG
jgi:hypothetical protein